MHQPMWHRPMLKKNIVQQKFDCAAHSYDSNANIQDECSSQLVNIVASSSANHLKKIADIGSGTGTTTQKLLPHARDAEYSLFDISPNMLSISQKKLGNKNIQYIACDAEKHIFTEQYDLVISNLCLQWFEDIESFIKKIMLHTKYFVFSTLIHGSFAEFANLFEKHGRKSPLQQYNTFAKLEKICQAFDIHALCETHVYNKQCENAYDAACHFKSIGANVSNNIDSNISIVLRDSEPVNLEYIVFFGAIKR